MSGMKDGEMELAERLFYVPSGMELNAGLVPFIAGRMMAKPNYIAGPKAYGNYCLHFLTGGTMQYAYNKEVVELHKRMCSVCFRMNGVRTKCAIRSPCRKNIG